MWTIWRRMRARFHITDEEHISRVRRGVAAYDRWRRWLLALYVVLSFAFVGLLVAVGALLPVLMQLGGLGVAPGFFVGVALGLMIGGIGLKVGHGFVFLLAPPRTERLLLRYHDALTELANESATAAEAVEGRAELTATARRDG